MNQLRRFQFALFKEGVQRGVERFRDELRFRNRFQLREEVGEAADRVRVVDDSLLPSLFVDRESGVVGEKFVEIENVAGDFDSVARRRDGFFDRRFDRFRGERVRPRKTNDRFRRGEFRERFEGRVGVFRRFDQLRGDQVTQDASVFFRRRKLRHMLFLEREKLRRVERRRRFRNAFQGEEVEEFLQGEVLRFVVERPAEKRDVVVDRLGQIADLTVEVDDDRVETVGGRRQPDAVGDLLALLDELGEVAVFKVFVELALAQLRLAPRLRDERKVRVLRERIAERLRDEDLARRVRKVFFRSNNVRNLEVVVVDDVRQVVEAGTVGALNDVVLLLRPIEFDVAANQVANDDRTFARNLQTNDALTAFRFKTAAVLFRLGHKATAVNERALRGLRFFALRLEFFRSGVVAISEPAGEEFVDRRLVLVGALRLIVRRERAVHFRAFVPINAEPFQAGENRRQRLLDVPLLVGVVDAEDEAAFGVFFREQVAKKSGADAADVKVTGRTRRETRSNDGHKTLR